MLITALRFVMGIEQTAIARHDAITQNRVHMLQRPGRASQSPPEQLQEVRADWRAVVLAQAAAGVSQPTIGVSSVLCVMPDQ